MKMEHLKITREQERALINHMGSLEKLIRMHRNEDENTVLDDLTTDQLIDAYFGYYTIKETFEVGDWVVTTDGMIAEIIDVCMFHKDNVALYGVDGRHSFDTLRHATPEEIADEKQRRWWAKNDRKAWELKQKDILVKGNCESIVDHVGKEDVVLIKNGLKVVVKMFNIKKYYRVRYFAEDRKDVDHDN